MSYAVMITSKVDTEYLRQLIVATHDNNTFFYERTTNGGRGESNAWSQVARATDITEFIVGEVLSTPLTTVDTDSITNNELPTVLIQKLTKQFRLRNQDVSDSLTNKEVLTDVFDLINQDPQLLSKYRSDGRSDKNATTNRKATSVATITKPLTIASPIIKVVHENYKEDSLSFIPSLQNPEVSGYVNRTITQQVNDFAIFDYAIANNENVAIVGEAGTGKTTSVMSWAGHRGLRFYRINFHAGVESSQIFGKLLPKEDGALAWQDGGFTECWRNGNAVIVLDEMSFMPPKQAGILFPCLDNQRVLILLDNKGEVIPAGDNLLIVGCYNEGYRGNNKPNQAFIDRFQHKLVFDYDTDIEKKFIKSSTLLDLAKQMRADSIAGIYETPISTRLLKNFQKFAKEISYDYAVDNFLNNFSAEERGSVKLLLDAHRHNLELELTGVSN